jgi:hypothetical protein
MAGKQNNSQQDATAELLKDLLIVELAKAGVQQKEIRKIAGCDMRRVSRIAKAIKSATRGAVE